MKKLDSLFLRVVRRLEPDAYGVPVRQAAEEEHKSLVSYGEMYATLDRLEDLGYVTSEQIITNVNGVTRQRKYWSVTKSGIDISVKEYEAQKGCIDANTIAGVRV